jgi:hypothetical protein
MLSGMPTSGTGSELWRVRVDLFATDADAGRVTASATALRSLLDNDEDRDAADVGADQGLGVTGRPVVGLLFWVRADDVGEAALTAVETARRAGADHGVGPELYDVTLIPPNAVVLPGDVHYPSMPD